jgi:hypothetical protein
MLSVSMLSVVMTSVTIKFNKNLKKQAYDEQKLW